MSKDFYTKMKEEQELLDLSMKESIRQKKERMPVEWIYTKEFYCDGNGEHPRVYYKIEFNEAICGYCNIKYKYREADI